jgi:xanthine dehydrogenase molybdopterin binding subunit/xanthine dehydrogenase small subunit
MRTDVSFYINGKKHRVAGDAAFHSLTEYLRDGCRLVGTKIGCGEGDCGACSVLVGRPGPDGLVYRAATSCILALCQVDGAHVVSIEGLRTGQDLSPVQEAMVAHHGSQCGYCTPGVVVALTGLLESDPDPDEKTLRTGLTGNLCRCTGYLPILEAGRSVDHTRQRRIAELYDDPSLPDDLARLAAEPLRVESGRRVFYRPGRAADALAFKAEHPDAVIVSGGTDLGVWRNRRGFDPPRLLSLAGASEWGRVRREGSAVSIGANVTWSALAEFAACEAPELLEVTHHFASPQIRNVATFVGNVANGSPIADAVSFLHVAGALLELVSTRGSRSVAVGDFFTGYRQTVLAPDEIVARVVIPRPAPGERIRLYKVSKRKEMDISTFRAGINVRASGGRIERAALAFAGVGPKVLRLPATEAYLAGRPFAEATFREAGRRARAELEPISDLRGSRDYRLALAENVLLTYYDDCARMDRGEPDHEEPEPSRSAAIDGRAGPIRAGSSSALGAPLPHESACAHVTGEAVYIDDIPQARGELLVDFVGSPIAHGRIRSIDIQAASRVAGVAVVLVHTDIPGERTFGPIVADEEVLAADDCQHVGQPIVLIAAETRAALRAAKEAVQIVLEPLPAVLTIDEAIEGGHFLGPTRTISRGDAAGALERAENVLAGALRTGGQEHFYLETQAARAVPGEGGQILVQSSTQNPSEVQSVVARVLGRNHGQVVCECRRMGGGFGGKESQAAHPAALAALVAARTGRPARIVYARDQDMQVTGKRHPYSARYRVGFTSEGVINALEMELDSDGGSAFDLSLAVMERSMLHAENAYFLPDVTIRGTVCRTNLPPNTAFRGFGGPQGIAAIESVIEDVATHLGLDPLDVRRRNLYGGPGRDLTPYGQRLPGPNTLPDVVDGLAASSDYRRRRADVAAFNARSRTHLKGLALTPVKFGISFTRRTLNQANALVNLYLDGTVQVSTGGTEMGQGLNTKIQQLVADQLGLPAGMVQVMPTSTEKNNNTSPTAASATTDLNGAAAVRACEALKERLARVAARIFASPDDGLANSPDHVVFADGGAHDARCPGRSVGFAELVRLAYEDRVDLGARGFYATPGVDFNRETGRGNPFLYFTNGAAVAEVLVDRRSGEVKLTRVDILMDIGNSINPAIDRGQIIGGFVQAVGWVLTEDLRHSVAGELLSCSPSNYKIPAVSDVPADFRVAFLDSDNPGTVAGSKAVGEPPFVLGLSVWAAVNDALRAAVPGRRNGLRLPATGEEVLRILSGSGETVCDGDRPMRNDPILKI